MTWDDKPENRAAHAALEGKAMPPLSVTGWMNGTVTAADCEGQGGAGGFLRDVVAAVQGGHSAQQ